jgi:hypothetical protein
MRELISSRTHTFTYCAWDIHNNIMFPATAVSRKWPLSMRILDHYLLCVSYFVHGGCRFCSCYSSECNHTENRLVTRRRELLKHLHMQLCLLPSHFSESDRSYKHTCADVIRYWEIPCQELNLISGTALVAGTFVTLCARNPIRNFITQWY